MENNKAMTALAYELASRAIKVDKFYIIYDEAGKVLVNTNGTFARINNKGKMNQYMSGEYSTSNRPYGVVSFKINGIYKTVYQHILMAMLEHNETYEEGLIVGHKNSIKWDNTPDNLEWITPKQNDTMRGLLIILNKRYPEKYTKFELTLNLDWILTSKIRIPHNRIDDILAVIDDEEELDFIMNHL